MDVSGDWSAGRDLFLAHFWTVLLSVFPGTPPTLHQHFQGEPSAAYLPQVVCLSVDRASRSDRYLRSRSLMVEVSQSHG
jgi:hypothetical protein